MIKYPGQKETPWEYYWEYYWHIVLVESKHMPDPDKETWWQYTFVEL